MKRISVTDANREFNKMTREVDEEGIIALTKFDEDQYIIMKKAYYEEIFIEADILNRIKNTLWAKSGDNRLKLFMEDGKVKIYEVKYVDDEPDLIIKTTCPVEALEITLAGDKYQIKVRPKGFMQEMTEAFYAEKQDKEVLKEMKTAEFSEEIVVLHPLFDFFKNQNERKR